MQNLQYKHPKTGEWLDLDKAMKEGYVKEVKKKQKFKNPKTGKFVIESTAKKNGFLRDGDLSKDTFFGNPFIEKGSSISKNEYNSTDTTRFLVTPRSNLLTFFTHALIFPAFLDNIFSQDETNLPLMLKSKLPEIQENDIALELILTVDEVKLLEDGCYLKSALPISRVVNIHADIKTIKAIKEELQTFPDTYIPDFYFVQAKNISFINYISEKHIVREPSAIYSIDRLKKSKDYYNRVLGMLGYMKCCSLYFADVDNFSSQYSRSFFSVLSPLNKKFTAHDNTKEIFWRKFFLSQKKDELIDIVINDIKKGKEISREWVKELLLNAPLEIQKIFHQVVFRDFKKEALSQLNKREWWEYYVLAAIYNYRKENSIPQVPLNIVNDINPKFAEIILAILGFYHGYAKLPKHTNINLGDAFFDKLAANHNNIKFKLETNLEKKIIETVYQFCFNGKTNISNYTYLENNPINTIIDLVPSSDYKIERTFQFGERIITYHNQKKHVLEFLKQTVIEKFNRIIPSANNSQLQKIKSILEQISNDL